MLGVGCHWLDTRTQRRLRRTDILAREEDKSVECVTINEIVDGNNIRRSLT